MIRSLVTCSAVASLVVGCTSVERPMAQFDIVAGLADGEEPARLDYASRVDSWNERLEASGAAVDEDALENPSGFARDQLRLMVEAARDDFGEIAEVTPRLLLVAFVDENALNRIEALEGLGEFLADLGIDPVAWRLDGSERTAAMRSTLIARLDAMAAAAREAPLTDAARSEYAALLRESVAGRMDTPAGDRALLRRLTRSWRAENDRRLRDALREAVRIAIGNAVTRALAVSLRTPDIRVRMVAAEVLFRRGGSASVPMLLTRLARTAGARPEYPEEARERRMLLRMCATLGGDALFASFDAGPRPIDFLYDSVVRDEDEGLRFVALETMARCLGRRVSFDREWADQWWREFSLGGGRP